jgi:uncharacterized SAM-binding protein YcdF (DUF218 family)
VDPVSQRRESEQVRATPVCRGSFAIGGLVGLLTFTVLDLVFLWGSQLATPLPIVAFVLGGVWARSRWRAGLWWSAALATLAVLVLAASPAMPVLVSGLVREDPLAPADAVVCLSSSATNEGRLDAPGTERFLATLAVAREAGTQSIVRTTLPAPYPPVDEDIREMVSLTGTSAEVVAVGPVASTRDEAVHVAELARERGWSTIILVTGPTHSRRAAAVFEGVGLRVISRPCPSRMYSITGRCLPRENLLLLQSYAHEQLGWLVYHLRGWIR